LDTHPSKSIRNVPNLLSGTRMALMPVLIVLAAQGWKSAFLICLVFALITDAADGFLARRWNQVTEFGASLDSWADAATWLGAIVGAHFLWPALIRREITWLVVMVAVYLLTILIGFIKFRRLTSYHTWGAKAAAVTMSVAGLVLLVTGLAWPFHVGACVMMLSCVEEVAITVALRQWRCDVPSLWHALRLRRIRSGLA
jgi:phosphatidylglycerophosphate synthase